MATMVFANGSCGGVRFREDSKGKTTLCIRGWKFEKKALGQLDAVGKSLYTLKKVFLQVLPILDDVFTCYMIPLDHASCILSAEPLARRTPDPCSGPVGRGEDHWTRDPEVAWTSRGSLLFWWSLLVGFPRSKGPKGPVMSR